MGSLPDDNELSANLKAVDYGYDASDAILLERKDYMRRRGLAWPEDGDAKGATQFIFPNGMKLRFDLYRGQFIGNQGPHINLEYGGRNIHIPLSP